MDKYDDAEELMGLSSRPRKLTFDMSPEQKITPPTPKPAFVTRQAAVPRVRAPEVSCMSPPYRKIRALRLMDTPATPKTLLQKIQASQSKDSSDDDDYFLGGGDKRAQGAPTAHAVVPPMPRPVPVHHPVLSVCNQANVNPFTPDGMLMKSKKRARFDANVLLHQQNPFSPHPRSAFDLTSRFSNTSSVGDEEEEDQLENYQAPKRLALQDTNISRYEREFIQLSVIGAGEFGEVFRCLNRLDGCIYAVKKSKKPVAGSAVERIALNEVWAHAVLGKHDNVVRYYSAWAENNHMLIQNEFCDGGSLQSLLQTRPLTEPELRLLVAHIAEGLKYIHSNDLVHLDLKAGNIFIAKTQHRIHLNTEVRDDGFVDACEDLEQVTYKIGDLGHVTSVLDPDVEEGDCRYLPAEILHEDYAHLTKADIFALGITLYEAAGGGPLPKNGVEWHRLRSGQVPRLPNLSPEFNDLIAQMTHPDPTQRPSATTITRHPCLEEDKSKAQLLLEIKLQRQKNLMLQKALSEAEKKIKAMQARTPAMVKRLNSSSAAKSDRRLRSCEKRSGGRASRCLR